MYTSTKALFKIVAIQVATCCQYSKGRKFFLLFTTLSIQQHLYYLQTGLVSNCIVLNGAMLPYAAPIAFSFSTTAVAALLWMKRKSLSPKLKSAGLSFTNLFW